jgi:hypothetical protein
LPDVCAGGWPAGFSWDARIVAIRVGVRIEQLVLVHPDGQRVHLGALARFDLRGYPRPVLFSPDSTRVAGCKDVRGREHTFVADVASGRILERHFGSCEFAFTDRGLAIIRGGRVVLRGRVLFEARRSFRDTRLGLPLDLAANMAGTRLAVTTRDYVRNGNADEVAVNVIDLQGRVLGRYRKRVPILLDPLLLGPQGRSMLVSWGDIYQLARLDAASHTFALLFGVSGPAVTRAVFSPSGRFAAMAQSAAGALRAPRPKLNAVVLDGRTFKPLYQLPVAVHRVVTWLP